MKARAPSGIMECDSAHCATGAEITTYDSLDASLGQARQGLYLATKSWAAAEGLALIHTLLHLAREELPSLQSRDAATEQAMNTARLIAHLPSNHGVLPAICNEQVGGREPRILPAIEGLLFLLYWETVRHKNAFPDALEFFPNRFLNHGFAEGHALAKMLSALRTHTITLLSDPDRRNHFHDGGIRLSSASDNSWLSKIALVQHVARELFNLDENGKERPAQAEPGTPNLAGGWEKSDAAHVRWITEGESAYWAASDQFITGIAKGSRYYPRLITTALWLSSKTRPARSP